MLHTFIAFLAINASGLYFCRKTTIVLLIIYLILGCVVIGPLTYEACLYSILPPMTKPDYDEFTPNLKDKTILVTGANRGVGLGIVKELVSHGSNVIIACRNGLNKTVNNLKQIANEKNQNVKIRAFKLDLSKYPSYISFFKQLQYVISHGNHTLKNCHHWHHNTIYSEMKVS